jgi:hypothetical protein
MLPWELSKRKKATQKHSVAVYAKKHFYRCSNNKIVSDTEIPQTYIEGTIRNPIGWGICLGGRIFVKSSDMYFLWKMNLLRHYKFTKTAIHNQYFSYKLIIGAFENSMLVFTTPFFRGCFIHATMRTVVVFIMLHKACADYFTHAIMNMHRNTYAKA